MPDGNCSLIRSRFLLSRCENLLQPRLTWNWRCPPRLQVRRDSSAGVQMATASRCTPCVACCRLKGQMDLFKAAEWADRRALPANKVNRFWSFGMRASQSIQLVIHQRRSSVLDICSPEGTQWHSFTAEVEDVSTFVFTVLVLALLFLNHRCFFQLIDSILFQVSDTNSMLDPCLWMGDDWCKWTTLFPICPECFPSSASTEILNFSTWISISAPIGVSAGGGRLRVTFHTRRCISLCRWQISHDVIQATRQIGENH